jgi:putative sigma-54 modulation protein
VRDYVSKKVGRLDRYLPDTKATRVDLNRGTVRSQGEVYTAQITAWVDSTILRAEEMNPDLFAAIDLAADKLRHQMERYKGKRLQRWHDRAEPLPLAEEEPGLEPAGLHVTRRKRFGVYPMAEGEAIEQFELLGHDFFLYLNADSGEVNALYRRKDGQLGLLELEPA